jgi:putative flippase GtrA
MNWLKKITSSTFIRYGIVGAIATAVDWGSFYISAYLLNLYYQISLVISFVLGTLSNYILNRTITFKSKTKNKAQIAVHFGISLISLGISSLLMFLFIEKLFIGKMVARISTTALVFFLNYFMHKNITFNKRIFK